MKKTFSLIVAILLSLTGASACGGSSNTTPTTTSSTTLAPTTAATTLPATTTTTATITKPPVTTKAPTTTTTTKSSDTAKLSDTQISTIWSSLTTSSRQFFDSGDLTILDRAAGTVKSKYAFYNTKALLGTSGDKMAWTLRANGYNECRIINDNATPLQLEPGC